MFYVKRNSYVCCLSLFKTLAFVIYKVFVLLSMSSGLPMRQSSSRKAGVDRVKQLVVNSNLLAMAGRGVSPSKMSAQSKADCAKTVQAQIITVQV